MRQGLEPMKHRRNPLKERSDRQNRKRRDQRKQEKRLRKM
jgi:hypothetical protein